MRRMITCLLPPLQNREERSTNSCSGPGSDMNSTQFNSTKIEAESVVEITLEREKSEEVRMGPASLQDPSCNLSQEREVETRVGDTRGPWLPPTNANTSPNTQTIPTTPSHPL